MDLRIRTCATLWFVAVALDVASAETFTINTPGGPVRVDVSHAGPGGSLVTPEDPRHAGFRPPTIFSAPLPSGSGARALGQAGAFTAVADDATAASWNPAGLIQLARPEASAVYRFSRARNEHSSASDSLLVGEDDFSNDNLNYFSLALPFRVLDHNIVVSINYQEAYDFTQAFSAHIRQSASRTVHQSSSGEFEDVQHDRIVTTNLDIRVTSHVTTRMSSRLSQIIRSDLLTDLAFEQEGIIDAVTPAVAVEINPRLSLGLAVNFYGNDQLGGDPIRSRTVAHYSGTSSSYATIVDERSSEGTYEYEGTWYRSSGAWPPVEVPIPRTSGDYPSFSDTSRAHRQSLLYVDGEYEEINEFDDLHGVNATFGILWSASRRLSLGLAVDIPWTADARQKKVTRNEVTTYNESRTRILDQSTFTSIEEKDVEFDFPLYWAIGALWRWNDQFYTSLDISQTLWSDFSFEAAGEEQLNPLDGTPHGQNPIDDCWAARFGTEYLLLVGWTEIPLRAGAYWEERPAIENPDEYWGFTLGSGISLGKDPGKLIIDAAYIYRQGNDVMDCLVPDEDGLETDAIEHQFYLSSIWHF